MKIALGQINPTVGDFTGNYEIICKNINEAINIGCKLIVFPELAITGYPPQDLLDRNAFITTANEFLLKLRQKQFPIDIIIGMPWKDDYGFLRNALAVIKPNHKCQFYFKALLPTYDVFDEDRYFEPDGSPVIIDIDGVKFGLTICEDLWTDPQYKPRRRYDYDPIKTYADIGVDWIINASSSPFHYGKPIVRYKLVEAQAIKHKLGIIYVNQIGGNDSLIFDGQSFAMDNTGKVIARAKAFAEELYILDLAASNRIEPIVEDIASVEQALVLATRDYMRKCGMKKAIIGLSGGIDSAVTAAITVRAIGAENVRGVAMPSQYSSEGSMIDAKELAANLNIQMDVIHIQSVVEAYRHELEPIIGEFNQDLTEQNLQARIRGNYLMAYSNKHGYLLISTGNKSEFAMGYSTLYGDMSGGWALLCDVPKTMVYELAHYLIRENPTIPLNSITKPPSAELKPNQKDQDDLPPYELIDTVMRAFLEEKQSVNQIIAAGHDSKVVHYIIKRILRYEFKRRQAPLGPKITQQAFGSGWYFPIAHKVKVDEV